MQRYSTPLLAIALVAKRGEKVRVTFLCLDVPDRMFGGIGRQ